MPWAKNSVGTVGDNVGLPDITKADDGKTVVAENAEWSIGKGGGGLPPIEEGDTGKVLTAGEDGAVWASGGGGGGQLFVVSSDDDVLNKTYAEIKAAFDSGAIIVLRTRTTEDGNDFYADEPLAGIGVMDSPNHMPVFVVDFFNPYNINEIDSFSASNETDYPTLD